MQRLSSNSGSYRAIAARPMLPRPQRVAPHWIVAVCLWNSMACSTGAGAEAEETGVAKIALTATPADAHCLQIIVVGTRTVRRNFELTPGSTAALMLPGLPVGQDTFSGLAYGTPCSAVDAQMVPTWGGAPVDATISFLHVAEVSLVLRRIGGQANVSVDFEDDDIGSASDAGLPPLLTLEPGTPMVVGPSAPNGAAYITAGDLNNDGWPDLALAEGYKTGGILLNQKNETFAPELMFSESWWDVAGSVGASSVAVADLDLDGSLDYVFALYGEHYVGNSIQLYQGDGRGNHTVPSQIPNGLVSTLRGANPMGTRVADFDHNGLPDIATGSNNGGHTADLILQTGPWVFRPTFAYSQNGSANPQWIEIGDFNNDGWMDLVVPFLYGKVEVYLNTANGTGAMTYSGGYLSPYHNQVAVADFDGDGSQDIAARNNSTSEIVVLYNNGTGGFPTTASFPVSGTGGSVHAGDMNGDGAMDLVVCSASSSAVDVLLNDGRGAFASAITVLVAEPPVMAAVDDFDQDGDQDVALYTTTTNVGSHVQLLWNRRQP
jgi:hypothetical protein